MKEFIKLYKSGKIDWEETGLLSNLAEDQKPQMIQIFEQGMKYTSEDDDKNQLILPILRRIYTGLVDGSFSNGKNKNKLWVLIDVDDIMKSFDELYETTLPHFYNFKNLDAQAEFCATFTHNYLAKINSDLKEKYSSNSIDEYLTKIIRDKKIDYLL